MEWYVAKIKPHAEQRLEGYLAQHGVEVYAPRIAVAYRGIESMEPLFPGYVFVRTASISEKWNLVQWARGLSYLLPNRIQPTSMADSVVEEIRSQVSRWNSGGWIDAYKAGDHVIIQAGPLKTLDAIFQRYVPRKQRCEVLISLMGGPLMVQVDIASLHGVTSRQRFATLD